MKLSVRDLVEWILRSGDIDYRYMSARRAQEGTRVHQALQRERKRQAKLHGFRYESEVSLSLSFSRQGFELCLEGRADGIIIKDKEVYIEEIKSTYQDLSEMTADFSSWHFAQAKCYAYMYCKSREINEVIVNLTYCHVDSLETKIFDMTYTAGELEDFFNELIDLYLIWLKEAESRKTETNESIKDLAFPFASYRKGQRDFSVAVYKSLKNGRKLFAQAPTGTGKTISTLFPAIKLMGQGGTSKLFYLTAKTITRQVAEDSIEAMLRAGLNIRSVTITAKDKICFSKAARCTPEDCGFAEGHFNRVNDAIRAILANERIIRRDDVEAYAKRYRLCPYEFCLDICLWADIIVCDYNYVFDPTVKLKRFFSEGMKTDFMLLVDEAHNLVDRSREMFSAELSGRAFREARKLLDRKCSLYKNITKLLKYFEDVHENLLGDGGIAVKEDNSTEFLNLLHDFQEACDKWLGLNEGSGAHEEVTELYFQALDYLRVAEVFDSTYKLMIWGSKANLRMKQFCLDPAPQLAEAMAKLQAAALFSATLTPLSFFSRVLSGGSEDYTMKLASPFEKDNLLVLINNRISTKFKDRQQSYGTIADALYTFVMGRTGNYFVFFSSYEYLFAVCRVFEDAYPEVRTLVQEQDMDEAEREKFLANFVERPQESLLAFAVLGGIFSEGIDLTGDRLIGVAVVGVGLPMISEERDIISDYYRNNNEDGFSYAYVYPGMNKVLQSAGRLIRTETDRGIVLLIDSRFTTGTYLSLFPNSWQDYQVKNTREELEEAVSEFWGDKNIGRKSGI